MYFRAAQGHAGRNLIDPLLQDSVVIQSNFFQYTYMSDVLSICILSSVLDYYLEVKSLSNRQTVFFLLVDPMDKNHKDPDVIDLSVPRHAQYLHKTWKRHQDAVYWVDINLTIEIGLKFYQTGSNAIISQETLPAYCIPKDVRMEKWRNHIRESIHVTPASSEDLLETRVEKRIGFRTCSTIRSWTTI